MYLFVFLVVLRHYWLTQLHKTLFKYCQYIHKNGQTKHHYLWGNTGADNIYVNHTINQSSMYVYSL